jgi:hypothetical protein
VVDLKRLVLDYRTGELVMRVLYSTQDGPGPMKPGTRSEPREALSFLTTASNECSAWV